MLEIVLLKRGAVPELSDNKDELETVSLEAVARASCELSSGNI